MRHKSDAQWFTREEILAILRHPSGTNLSKRDYKAINDRENGADNDKNHSQQYSATNSHSDPSVTAAKALSSRTNTAEPRINISNEDPPFRVPPNTAIAGVLIQHWAEGKVQGNIAAVPKGSL
jgi:NAD+ diphosphatase